MAIIRQAKDETEVKAMTVGTLRREYNLLAKDYIKILDSELVYCPKCGNWLATSNFIGSEDTVDKLNHYACKKCLVKEATDFNPKTRMYEPNKEKTILTLQRMDLPFIDSVYESALQSQSNDVGERSFATPWVHYLAMIRSLPHFNTLHFKDSQYSYSDELSSISGRKPKKSTIKRFGNDWPAVDLLYLEDQYEDWVARTQIDSKSQEMYVMQICLQTLDIDKDRKAGKDVSNKIKALDTLMNAANLQPKQNVNNSATDSLTFGQLIEKWETEKPIPEPTEEFKDVDGIGKYIRVWFAGWLSKAVGLKGAFTDECEKYIEEYTVHKPIFNDDDDGVLGDAVDSLFDKGEE